MKIFELISACKEDLNIENFKTNELKKFNELENEFMENLPFDLHDSYRKLKEQLFLHVKQILKKENEEFLIYGLVIAGETSSVLLNITDKKIKPLIKELFEKINLESN